MQESVAAATGSQRGAWPRLRVAIRRLRDLPRCEEATSDVEYLLILALVVVPLCIIVPSILIETNAEFFRKIDLVTSFPYP